MFAYNFNTYSKHIYVNIYMYLFTKLYMNNFKYTAFNYIHYKSPYTLYSYNISSATRSQLLSNVKSVIGRNKSTHDCLEKKPNRKNYKNELYTSSIPTYTKHVHWSLYVIEVLFFNQTLYFVVSTISEKRKVGNNMEYNMLFTKRKRRNVKWN